MSSLSPYSRSCGITAALVFFVSSFAWAQPAAPPTPPASAGHDWCATGDATDQRLESIHSWVDARNQRLEKSGKSVVRHAQSRIENDIVLLEPTESMLPFHHPFDLENRSITYTPAGDGTFTVSTSTLEYDEDIGELSHTFEISGSPAWFYQRHEIGFAFPLGDQTHTSLYVSAYNAIYFQTPTIVTTEQVSCVEALSFDHPIVAPLLQTYQGTIFPLPEIYVKEAADAVTLTWRSGPSEWNFGLDIQARLESSGRIRFSYREVNEFSWGSVLVSSGDEPWRRNRVTLYSEGTVVPSLSGTPSQMLDLRAATVERVADSNLLEVTLTVTARIWPTILGADDFLGYYVELLSPSGGGGDWIYLYITRDEIQYRTPGWDWTQDSPAATFDTNTIKLRVLEDTLNLTGSTVYMNIWTFGRTQSEPFDGMSGTFDLGSWSNEVGTDLSSVTGTTTLPGPVVESFTLGVLDPRAVWSDLKSTYWFNDAQVDGVAIYQDFYTDIVLYAGAYSTVGNPGIDGISTREGYGTAFPRFPALLHMNTVGYRHNFDLTGSYHVLSHELGHRWLYFINIDRGNGPERVLRPISSHPAQYVHTPAAFNVYTATDSSTMGGASFTDHGDGTFSTPPQRGFYGYSWHDLYLMGLATPEEVEDWYFIEGTDPPLGLAYYPPFPITVSGTRQNVTIDHLTRAMGPRMPTAAASQKRFKTIFVLLSKPGTVSSPATLQNLNDRRLEFEAMFPVATGQRASVDTTTEEPERRRGVRR